MDKEMFGFYKNALQGEITNPLCADYKNEWRACGDDKEKLISLALRQQSLPYIITHCYQGKGISKEYILNVFSNYINGSKTLKDCDGVQGYNYGMWVGVNDYFLKPHTDVTAYMWVKDVTLRIGETTCPIIYIGCGSTVKISPEGYNSICIYLFDDSKVVIDDWGDETTKVVIYRYSADAQVEISKYCLADVKVFDKELRL